MVSMVRLAAWTRKKKFFKALFVFMDAARQDRASAEPISTFATELSITLKCVSPAGVPPGQ